MKKVLFIYVLVILLICLFFSIIGTETAIANKLESSRIPEVLLYVVIVSGILIMVFSHYKAKKGEKININELFDI